MKSNQTLYHILQINFAILLISSSGALGRFIEMAPPLTIWLRAIFGAIFLAAFCIYKKIDFRIGRRSDLFTIIIAGVLMCVHWVTYFYSLKLSSVAIGMLSLFTYPIITTFIEPLMLKTKFQLIHLLLAILGLTGIYIMAPELSFHNSYTQGIALGIFSAFCFATRNVLLKRQVSSYSGSTIMFYQLVVVSALLIPVIFMYDFATGPVQWTAIVSLALFTTAIGHTLLVMSFRNFSISTASIISGAQPIYGIVIGIILLGEIPELNTIIGGSLILVTVILESVRSSREISRKA